MSPTLYRSFRQTPPRIVRGEGVYLFGDDGKRYLDFSSSACYASLGHSNREVIEAIHQQLLAVPQVFAGWWSSAAADRAGELIASSLPEGWLGRAIFQQSGTEAVEMACKLAYQYHAEMGQGAARVVFGAMEQGFHGVGMLSFALSDYYPRYDMIRPYHERMDELVVRFQHPIGEHPSQAAMTQLFARYGHRMVAFIIEPVSGPPLGAYVYSKKFMKLLRSLCTQYGVVLIFDEVLCGAGRCGYLSLASYYDVLPDIILLGKGISAGYQPVSVICMSQAIAEVLTEGSGSLQFGSTYNAHTAGCAAVVATLEYMVYEGVFHRVKELGPSLGDDLRQRLGTLPTVGDIRGLGFLWGIELHVDHATVRARTAEAGVLIYSKGGTVDGGGNFVTVAPPLTSSLNELIDGVNGLHKGLSA